MEKLKYISEKNDFYRQIFDNSIDPIYLIQVTPEGRFVHLEINPAFFNAVGVAKEEIVGHYVDELEDEALRNTLINKYQACLDAGTKIEYISEFNLPIGHRIYQSTLSPLYNDSGRIHKIAGIARDITEHKTIEKKIEFITHHDALTGLPNRILAKNRMERAIAHAKCNNNQAALIFIDLDEFKTINDSLGHTIGDAMLKSVSLRLSASIRETDTLSSQGGNEFLLIMPDINERNNIVTIVEKLIQEFERSFKINNQVLDTSASIGIAVYPTHGDSFESLIQSADAAMYKAKELGKNGYCFYTPQMTHNLIGQFKLKNDLKSAIRNNEFILHYQPQIDIINHRITGVEALIRWKHPQLGIVPPMSFISIAESSGLIIPISEWVLIEACRQGALWHRQGMKITIAVNISAVQFNRGNLEGVVKNALNSSGLNPRFLDLELTESIMMHNVEKTLKTVRNLKNLNVQLSIDDFGTGYSSLAYLKLFAVNKLKIDQSFIRNILNNQEDAIIVNTIIQMAKSLNLQTIAEGVENADVLNIIQSYGCDKVQGYHFAKPMEALHFEKYHAEFNNQINS